MDKETKIIELKNKVTQFCEERDWDQFHNPKDLAINIITEASELLEIFRYKNLEEVEEIMHSSKKEHVEEEIADVFFSLLRFADKNDIDLTKALLSKIEKNNEHYPVDKVKGSNKKYNEY